MIIYCTQCEADTKHIVEYASNGDFIYNCVECGHFIKFPVEPTQEDLELHKLTNQHSI